MIPRPAQYLLRFDDLCPTVSDRWRLRLLPLIREFQICPILAVVPDNRDPNLQLDSPDSTFWAAMRELESAGAAIGLHGYHHLSNSRGRSLVPLHRDSEFAGVPRGTQRHWICEGLRILRNHQLNPRIWVAPRHGFDVQTLEALREEGVHMLSDGFAHVPFISEGMTWIPQQLWKPVEKSEGLWTICIHPNTASSAEIDHLRIFLRDHTAQFTSLDRVIYELRPASPGLAEHFYSAVALLRIQALRAKKRLVGELKGARTG